MKNENNNCVVLTLEDDISDCVLKSKNDEKDSSSSSSVALWIKSLKDVDVASDVSRSDQDAYDSHDDLQLGAEASHVIRKQRILSNSWRDSDSDGSNRWYSKTRRINFVAKSSSSYDRSLDSDTSGLSSVTSLSSLLSARESDPEDVLKAAGFRGPSVLDRIPDRFIDAGTICDGVDSERFIYEQIDEDSDVSRLYGYEYPPWVMARFNDIPGKFFPQNDDQFPGGRGSPIIDEITDNEGREEPTSHQRTPKALRCYSRFGTYLEPLTEEAEVSSQGSFCGSPAGHKAFSFESNLSTIKGNSVDTPIDSEAKIPSLCELLQTSENEQESTREGIKSEEFIMVPKGNVEGSDVLAVERTKENSNVECEDATGDGGLLSQWISPSETPASEALSLAQGKGELYTSSVSYESTLSKSDNCIPALSVMLASDDDPTRDDHRDVLEVQPKAADERGLEMTDVHHPVRLIPTVVISEPVEKSRKISTVVPPDPEKLSAVVRSCKNAVYVKTQLYFRDRGDWSVIERKTNAQIQFTCKGKGRYRRKLVMRDRKTANIDVLVTVNGRRATEQLTLPACHVDSIECFSFLDDKHSRRSSGNDFNAPSEGFDSTSTSAGSSVGSGDVKERDRTLLSLPLQNERHGCNIGGRRGKKAKSDAVFVEGTSATKGKCKSFQVSRLKSGASLKKELSVEEELGGLEDSLKGVKLYKAGIHLMQLASSVETVVCSEKRPSQLHGRSNRRLLGYIQNELKHLEEYILRLQRQLKELKRPQDEEHSDRGTQRRGSDFSDITKELLQEQLKMFTSLSSSVSSSSNSRTSPLEESPLSSNAPPDLLFHTDVMKLRREVQQLRQDSEERETTLKEEIFSEMRAEIRNCFQEFFSKKSP